MLKYSALILLVVVAISLSEVDAGLYKWRDALGRKISLAHKQAKREASEEVSSQEIEKVMKEFLADVLLLGAESEEKPALIVKFRQAMSQHFDNMEDYGKELLKIFEEVTKRKFISSEESEETNDVEEMADLPPLARGYPI